MNKITEINIISEGIQLKKLIEEKYSYTKLAKQFGLEKITIEKYLGKMVIDIGSFIQQIEELFQMPYNQIITPVEEQVKEYILNIKSNIKQYKQADDNKIMMEICQLAEKYCQPYEQLMAKGSLAIYKYTRGYTNEAIEILQEVLDSCEENEFKELIAYYSVHFAYFFLGKDIKQSRKILRKAEKIIDDENSIDQLSQLTLFNYYHFYGVTLRRAGKHGEARKKYKKAIEYAEDDTKIARALSNIAMTYHEEGSYIPAMEWYNRALDKAKQHDNIKSGILNNMANLYLENGNVHLATLVTEKAMKLISSESDPSRRIVIYDTYLDIHGENGDKLLKDIIDLLDQYVVFTEHEQYLVSCLEKSLDLLIKNENYKNIQDLICKILRYSRIEGEKRPLNDLKAVSVNAMQYLEDVDRFEITGAFKAPEISS